MDLRIGALVNLLEKRMQILLILAIAMLIAYKVMGCAGKVCVTPTLIDIVLIGLLILLVLIIHGTAKRLEGRKVVALLILASLVSQFAVYTFKMDEAWHDPRGYVQGATVIHERGMIYFLENYHHFCGSNLLTGEEMDKIYADLETYGMGPYKEVIDDPEMCEEAPDRRAQHPPMWMAILSFFFFIFGASDLSAVIGTWIISLMIPVSLYFLLNELIPERKVAVTGLTFLLIVSPFYLVSTYAPFNRSIIMLLAILSTFLLIRSIRRGGLAYPILTGLVLSFAMVTNLIFVTFYIPFLLILLLSGINRMSQLRIFGIILLSSAAFPLILMPLGYNILVNVITAKHAIDRFHIIRPAVYSGLAGMVAEKLKFTFWISLPVSFLVLVRILRAARERSLKSISPATSSGLIFLAHLGLVIALILSQEVTFKHMVFALPLLYLIPADAMEKHSILKRMPLMIAITVIQTFVLLFT